MNGKALGRLVSRYPGFSVLGSRLKREGRANWNGFWYGDFIMIREGFIFYGFLELPLRTSFVCHVTVFPFFCRCCVSWGRCRMWRMLFDVVRVAVGVFLECEAR
jgi:hypothetical protein